MAQISPALAVADALFCVGLGFLLAVLYDGMRFLLGSFRAVSFVLDNLAFLLAAVLLCGFAAGRSNTGTVRWYMAAGLCAGLAGYFRVLAPLTRNLRRLVLWALSRPAVLLWLLVLRPVLRLILQGQRALWSAVQAKSRKCRKKHQQKRLQKHSEILYNSN